MSTPKRISGGAQLKKSGKHPVLIGVLPDDLPLFRQAATIDGRPLTQLFYFHTLAAVKKILAKSDKNT